MAKKMAKTIYVIEDRFTCAKKILMTVNAFLFNFCTKNKNIAANICLIHCLDKEEDPAKQEFNNIAADYEDIFTKQGIEKLSYDYKDIKMEGDPDKDFNAVTKIIDTNTPNDFVILLDLALEADDLKNLNDKKEILSQKIAKKYSENFIAYTHYEDSSGLINREDWRSSFNTDIKIFEFYQICGDVIYRPFINMIKQILKMEM